MRDITVYKQPRLEKKILLDMGKRLGRFIIISSFIYEQESEKCGPTEEKFALDRLEPD